MLALAALPSLAAAQDCRYQRVKFDAGTLSVMDDPIEGFDICAEVPKLVGTINGSYHECVNWADFIPSPEIFDGDSFPQIMAAKYHSWISTKKGDLELVEWAWWDYDFGWETGFAKVIGGTGNFAGAYGTLSYTPRFPNVGEVVFLEGYICTP